MLLYYYLNGLLRWNHIRGGLGESLLLHQNNFARFLDIHPPLYKLATSQNFDTNKILFVL